MHAHQVTLYCILASIHWIIFQLEKYYTGELFHWRIITLENYSAGEFFCWRNITLENYSAGELLHWRIIPLENFSAGEILDLHWRNFVLYKSHIKVCDIITIMAMYVEPKK